jgi:hypothetical protein
VRAGLGDQEKLIEVFLYSLRNTNLQLVDTISHSRLRTAPHQDSEQLKSGDVDGLKIDVVSQWWAEGALLAEGVSDAGQISGWRRKKTAFSRDFER